MKKMSLLMLAIVTGFAVMGQGTEQQEGRKDFKPLRTPMAMKTRFGVDVGVNLAKFMVSRSEFNPSATAPTNVNTKTSFHGGFFVDIPIGGMFSLKPQVLYSAQGAQYTQQQTMGGTTTTRNIEEDLHYVYVAPAALHLMTPGGFIAEAGPMLGFLVSADQEATVNGNTTETDIINQRKKTDVLLTTGVGYLSRIGLGLHARYNMGLSNVLKAEDMPQNGRMRNSVIQLGLMYHFGAHK